MISVADLGLGAGVGAIVGLALGAYLKGMFEESGKIDAAISRLEAVGKKAFKEAFEGEAGKRLASHQDIENVLSEVRKVTTETESIKAQIGGDVWLRQTVWVQKREAYAALLKALAEVQDCFTDLAASLGILEASQADPESDIHRTRFANSVEKKTATFAALLKLSLRFGEATLFDVNMPAQQDKFRENYGLQAATADTATLADTKQFANALFSFRRGLLSHMQHELGVAEQPPSVFV